MKALQKAGGGCRRSGSAVDLSTEALVDRSSCRPKPLSTKLKVQFVRPAEKNASSQRSPYSTRINTKIFH